MALCRAFSASAWWTSSSARYSIASMLIFTFDAARRFRVFNARCWQPSSMEKLAALPDLVCTRRPCAV